MHKIGMKPGRNYNAKEVPAIREELGIRWKRLPLRGEYDAVEARYGESLTIDELRNMREIRGAERAELIEDGRHDLVEKNEEEERNQVIAAEREALKHPASYPASHFVAYSRELAASHLAAFLLEFCLNPRVKLVCPGEAHRGCTYGSGESQSIPDHWDSLVAALRYFHDITGALLEYKARHDKKACAQLVETAVSKSVFRTLKHGLRTREIVVVQGVEGVGKSFSGEAWRECHLGEAVFVRLQAMVNQTKFFQALSAELGLASGTSQKQAEMQIRVEKHLKRSGLMLIIDEAHRLFPQAGRINTPPELMNWVYSCWDQKIPVALLVTPQFVSRMDEVERQTDWRSGQLKRRIKLWTTLPEKITRKDLCAIARNIAPRYTAAMIDEMVDFAGPSRRQIDAMRRAMSAAEFIADEKGRKAPTFQDLSEGITEAQLTDQAMTTPLDKKRQGGGQTRGRQRRQNSPDATPMQDGCSAPEDVTESADEMEFTRAVTPSRGTQPQMAEAVLE